MNSFGRLFRISIFGESHGNGIGICVDGCPAGLPLTETDFAQDLQRRRSGAIGTTPRKERDLPEILSGVCEGKTTGAPICILFRNDNQRSGDYADLKATPRPGHADFVAHRKYFGYNDLRGGGHFSGRITLGLVAAGVIAKKIIHPMLPQASILSIGGKTENWEQVIAEAMAANDSVGGTLACRVSHCLIGLGEPFFDALESQLAHIIFAIPAIKALSFGNGFDCAGLRGSQNNDSIVDATGKTRTNHAGGINGGISNGNDLYLEVAVKPTSSIHKGQDTWDFAENRIETLRIGGRHDACIALRVPVVLEAAVAVALADMLLIRNSQQAFDFKA